MLLRKSLRRWEIAGFLLVCAAGWLLQTLYRRAGGNALIAAFSAVNGSVWECMKLLYVPYFVFTMVEYAVFAEAFRNFFAAKAAAGAIGVLLLPLLRYSIAGMFGAPPAWVNAAIFCLCAATAQLAAYLLLTSFSLRGAVPQAAGFLLLWALVFAFVLFTYRTPQLPLFRDPVTFAYGRQPPPV